MFTTRLRCMFASRAVKNGVVCASTNHELARHCRCFSFMLYERAMLLVRNFGPRNRRFHAAFLQKNSQGQPVLHQKMEGKDMQHPSKNKKTKYDLAVPHDEIIAALRRCSSVHEQIVNFCDLVRMNDEEIAERFQICEHLELLLKPYFPHCKVFLIGSSISGFGFKGCDVDLTFQPNSETFPKLPKGQPIEIPTVEEIDEGKTPLSKVYELPSKLQLRFARRVLRKYSDKCHEPMYVISGRCPILQFYYGSRKLACDLSLGNSLALMSTKLMMFYCNFDERVEPLVKIISYWAKNSKLVGSLDKFKSYAFALMVFHFLQTRKPPILPPVEALLEKAEFFRPDVYWGYDFEKDFAKFELQKNSESIEELLRKFFFYYLYFDFSQAICPLTGKTVPKNVFTSEQPDEAKCDSKKFEASTICVQDPFELTWNVTTGVSYRYCIQFIRQVYSVCSLYQASKLWKPTSADSWGLACLLDERLPSRGFGKGPIVFTIPVSVTATGRRRSHSSATTKDLVQTASSNLLKILSYGLLFHCSILKMQQNCDSSSVYENVHYKYSDRLTDLNFTNDVLALREVLFKDHISHENNLNSFMTFHCATADTWQQRWHWEDSQPTDESSSDTLELEHHISVQILENNSERTKHSFEFICECFEEEKDSEASLVLLLTPLETSSFPPKLELFLKNYIPRIMEILLK